MFSGEGRLFAHHVLRRAMGDSVGEPGQAPTPNIGA